MSETQQAYVILEHAEMNPKRSKYNNTKRVIDGVQFDSVKEAARYAELKLMLAAGAIQGLELQPVFELQAKFMDAKGVKHRAIQYVGDFAYTSNGTLVVEECKGFETEAWKLKHKLFLYRYRSVDLRVLR